MPSDSGLSCDELTSPASARRAPFGPSFIETQFPISKLSKESYKERKGNASQTLTGLGKWWGRKPLIMVRAIILGLLMPASSDPAKDRDVFLALLTMDADGLRRRKRRNIPLKQVYRHLSPQEHDVWFEVDTNPDRPKLKKGTKASERKRLQLIVFDRLGYDGKLTWCDRPEQIDGPSPESWQAINSHLGTNASSLPEIVRELGQRRFGHIPRVGDAFCGGGSVPFEAARIGCEAFGSDLNPVAAMLTWGALNIVGGGQEVTEQVSAVQAEVFDAVDRQITEWRLEHNDVGWRADAFLYCTETTCPECSWRVPLAPSWLIGRKTQTVATLVEIPSERAFRIDIKSGVGHEAMETAAAAGTLDESRLECPHCDGGGSTSMRAIRGNDSAHSLGSRLRRWESDDLGPRPNDVFQERLYCVRWRLPPLDALLWAEQRGDPAPIPGWVDLQSAIAALTELLSPEDRAEIVKLRARDWIAEDQSLMVAERERSALEDGTSPPNEVRAAAQRVTSLRRLIASRTSRLGTMVKRLPKAVYRSVEGADLRREEDALARLKERFAEWQAQGSVPSRPVVSGDETTRLTHERGWTCWHHLFTPRQLLTNGLFAETLTAKPPCREAEVGCLLGAGRVADWNSKLSRWWTDANHEKVVQTFSNQALNTLANFGGRGMDALRDSWLTKLHDARIAGSAKTLPSDVRSIECSLDMWITDPPYADAVNYHELSEFFLAWYEKRLAALFPDWYTDSKRVLAVQGADGSFRASMVESYRTLARRMPNDGVQVVMFTHQDASVWADLALILWAAGLRVTTAWTIGTETPFGSKEGNYVQGTVAMVLRKQTSHETAFSDEVVPEVEDEVERQLDTMRALDDGEDPNFSDADYQLAAYAAALRVLTKYASIEDIDVGRHLARERIREDPNPIEAIIEDAVRTASNFLVPDGLQDHRWRRLSAEEKLYLKGVEIESHGDYRAGVYQEFARGFGVRDYRFLLRTGKANETRLKTPSEFERRELGDSAFGTSLVRHALYATWRTIEDDTTTGALTWLRTELPDYWSQREALIGILRYLATMGVDHWQTDANAARLVAGAVENDHV